MKQLLILVILILNLSFSEMTFANSSQDMKSQLIAQWPNNIQPLTIGSNVPDVTLWTGNGDAVRLAKLAHKGPSVISFYQGSWSPACSNQLVKINESAEQLKKLGYNIIAISPDSPHMLIKSRKKKDLNYLLLSDYHLEASQAFGLAYRVTKNKAKLYKKKYGAQLRQVKGEDQYNLPVPGIFIVDDKGKIQFQYVNPDLETQLSTGMLLEAAKMIAKNAMENEE